VQCDVRFGPGFEISVADISERDRAFEAWRARARGDAPHLFTVGRNDFGFRQRLSLLFARLVALIEDEPHEFLGYMASPAYARDELLPEVASFRETDGFIQTCFEDDRRLIHVDAVARDAGFDAQRLKRVEADGARSRSFR